jgi:hypothetical protein
MNAHSMGVLLGAAAVIDDHHPLGGAQRVSD